MKQEPEHYYDILEEQYEQAKESGVFDVMKLMELDEEHSDATLTKAVNYFRERHGNVDKQAPTAFLTQYEINMVNKNDKFRPNLYCMLLSAYLAEGVEKKQYFWHIRINIRSINKI